ncbi:hypothetical protein NXX53_18735 [Bacteroides salyersiae]|nr:hypothetical protein [Bacteroides salyersiae]
MELINKTRSGMISYCDHCKVYHLEFGNLFFRFTEDGFLHFRNYVVGINGTEAARMNHGLMSNRKIFLRLSSENVYFCLTNAELQELKTLVLLQTDEEVLQDFGLTFCRIFL